MTFNKEIMNRYIYNEEWNQVLDTKENRLIVASQMDVEPKDAKLVCEALNLHYIQKEKK